jgi:hypothetical protein
VKTPTSNSCFSAAQGPPIYLKRQSKRSLSSVGLRTVEAAKAFGHGISGMVPRKDVVQPRQDTVSLIPTYSKPTSFSTPSPLIGIDLVNCARHVDEQSKTVSLARDVEARCPTLSEQPRPCPEFCVPWGHPGRGRAAVRGTPLLKPSQDALKSCEERCEPRICVPNHLPGALSPTSAPRRVGRR